VRQEKSPELARSQFERNSRGRDWERLCKRWAPRQASAQCFFYDLIRHLSTDDSQWNCVQTLEFGRHYMLSASLAFLPASGMHSTTPRLVASLGPLAALRLARPRY
jgi:hypothetical protein